MMSISRKLMPREDRFFEMLTASSKPRRRRCETTGRSS